MGSTPLLLANEKNIYYLFFLTLFFQKNLFANLDNTIVVKIDDQIITSFEIKNKILTNLILSNQEINQENINNP